jgi:hypothetical protein
MLTFRQRQYQVKFVNDVEVTTGRVPVLGHDTNISFPPRGARVKAADRAADIGERAGARP